MGTPKDSERTRAKIIEAAGELFAEKGFKPVTVREIVKKADTHLSALNYHFNGKEALYIAVLEDACTVVASSTADKEALLSLAPKDGLYYYVHGSLSEYAKASGGNWRLALVSRNTLVSDEFSKDVIQRFFANELAFIGQLVSRAIDEPEQSEKTYFAVLSLVGLLDSFCVYGTQSAELIPEFAPRINQHDWLAKRIVTMFLAGIDEI